MTTNGVSPALGQGQILGTAHNSVIYGQNVTLQTDQGWLPQTATVTTLWPTLTEVVAPQVLVSGVASVSGTFGDPGAHDFKFTIDWHDGTIDTYLVENPGHFDFSHKYVTFPNTLDQSAPIPITVTVSNDQNIQLVGLQQAPIVTTIRSV